MFFTYLRRELRRRMRQAVFIAVGLALGVGLVITVTAAAAGVKNAQGTVLKALYGVGTDVTVTKTPAAGSFTPGSFGFGFRTGTTKRPAAGTKINESTLGGSATLASISSSSVTQVAGLHDVAAAAGGLTLTDRTLTGTMPAINFNGGGSGGGGFGGGGGGGGGQSFRSSFTPGSFGVDGVDLSVGELGPLSSGKLASGRTFTAADASADVAVLDSSYAAQNKLTVGSTIAVGNSSGTTTNFKVIGIVSELAGDNPSDVYVPLGVAQKLANLKNDVNTIYVAADNSSAIGTVSGEITKALPADTVTTSADLASEVTGSLSNASSLFRNASTASHTVAVHLAASVSSNVILLAVVLAVAGGIIAGTFDGWRAARLRPAAALSKVA
jgi:putative ABC transport system permease protein